LEKYKHVDWDHPTMVGGYVHALVADVGLQFTKIKLGRYTASLGPTEIAWTGHKLPKNMLAPGDILYVKVLALEKDGTAKVTLEQDSGAQGALLAIDNATGDVKAMVGGRDFYESKFNRAIQAQRQAGSSFKPYVYAAAVDQGAEPDDVIVDSPTTFLSGGTAYTPHNFDRKFEGAITLRHAIAESRNIPAVKLAQKVGMHTVAGTAKKFGITSPLQLYLPIALGAADLTLYEQTSAFAVFPNDGLRIEPRYIVKVTDYEGHVLEEDFADAKDVTSTRTARIMVSLLESVVQSGTARAALKLKHPLAGKTGTTNDYTDAWFIGFSPSVTCGVWVGFDEKRSLGPNETGGHAALPIWIEFMNAVVTDPAHRDEAFIPPTAGRLKPERIKRAVVVPPSGRNDAEDH
jgi:penicillin-binding protein 1A